MQKKNGTIKFVFTTTERATGNVSKHIYDSAREAQRAREAFIRHVCCRLRSKNRTISYEIYDYKNDKTKKITASAPDYKVGEITNV